MWPGMRPTAKKFFFPTHFFVHFHFISFDDQFDVTSFIFQEVMSSDLLAEPVFQVLAVRRLPDKASGSTVFRVELELSEEFFSDLSENALGP